MNIYEGYITTANKSLVRVEADSEAEARELIDEELYLKMSEDDSTFEEWTIDEIVETERNINL